MTTNEKKAYPPAQVPGLDGLTHIGRGLYAGVIYITPARAGDWLQYHNAHNYRDRSPSLVQMLSKILKAGHWRLNGESIVFDRDGNLKDGQNRLNAIVRTQIGAEAVIVFGIAPDNETNATIDTGKSRTATDVLRAEGYKNPQITAAVADAAYRYIYRLDQTTKIDALTRREFMEKNPELVDFVPYYEQLNTAGYKGSPRALIVAFFYLISQAHSDKAKQFIHQFMTSEGLHQGSPIYTLERMIRKHSPWSTSASERQRFFDYLAKAWNAHYLVQPLFRLQLGSADVDVDLLGVMRVES